MTSPTDTSLRAVEFYLEQLYDAHRGIEAAYIVDTGDTGPGVPPTWAELTPAQKNVWRKNAGPAFGVLMRAMTATVGRDD